MEKIVIDGKTLTAEKIYAWSKLALNPMASIKIEISAAAKENIQAASDFVSSIIKKDKAVYGINTGFGKFSEVLIPNEKLSQLQKNLIFSHASGVGDALPRDIVFMMWILRLNTLCRGNSGVRFSTVEFIVKLIESGVLATVPSRGSVGASWAISSISRD